MKKGFTIVELIIAGAIMATILGFAVSFIRQTNQQAAMATAIGTLRQEAELGLRAMERDIGSCRTILADEQDGMETYKADIEFGDSLVINVIPEDTANTKLFGEDDEITPEKITYSLSDEKLQRSGPDGTQVVARHVKSFGPADNSGDDSRNIGKIGIKIEMSMEVPGFKDKTASYTATVMASVRQLQTINKEGKFDLEGRNKYWRQHTKSN